MSCHNKNFTKHRAENIRRKTWEIMLIYINYSRSFLKIKFRIFTYYSWKPIILKCKTFPLLELVLWNSLYCFLVFNYAFENVLLENKSSCSIFQFTLCCTLFCTLKSLKSMLLCKEAILRFLHNNLFWYWFFKLHNFLYFHSKKISDITKLLA